MGSYLKIVLINIHTLETEMDKIIDLDYEMKKLVKYDNGIVDDSLLEDIGINYLLPTKSFELYDEDKFKPFIRKLIFPDSEIINCEGYIRGHPDFIIKKNGKVVYVELKNRGDGLRLSQLKWFYNNKDKECKVLFLNYAVVPLYGTGHFGLQKDGRMLL